MAYYEALGAWLPGITKQRLCDCCRESTFHTPATCPRSKYDHLCRHCWESDDTKHKCRAIDLVKLKVAGPSYTVAKIAMSARYHLDVLYLIKHAADVQIASALLIDMVFHPTFPVVFHGHELANISRAMHEDEDCRYRLCVREAPPLDGRSENITPANREAKYVMEIVEKSDAQKMSSSKPIVEIDRDFFDQDVIERRFRSNTVGWSHVVPEGRLSGHDTLLSLINSATLAKGSCETGEEETGSS